MSMNTGAYPGQAFTPPEYSSMLLEHLYASSIAVQSGIQRIATSKREIHIPRLTGDVTASWVQEGATLSETDPDADHLVAVPRKVATYTTVTNEAVADSDPAVLNALGASVMRSLALKVDKAVYVGSGTAPEPKGMLNVTGIQTKTNSAVLESLDIFSDAITALAEADANAGAIAMHPTDFGRISKLKESTDSNKSLMQAASGSAGQAASGSIYGIPVYQSSQLTAGQAFVYDPAHVYIVVRDDPSMVADTSRLFDSDMTAVRGTARVDVAVANAKAVCVINGLDFTAA